MFTSNLRCVSLGRSQTPLLSSIHFALVEGSEGSGEVEPWDCTVRLFFFVPHKYVIMFLHIFCREVHSSTGLA